MGDLSRITKSEWTRLGGLRNPSLARRQRNGRWEYLQDPDHPAARDPSPYMRPRNR